MSANLKPCPFCGSTVVSVRHAYTVRHKLRATYDGYDFNVACENCDSMGPRVFVPVDDFEYGDVIEATREAIEQWNMRHS